MHNEKTIIFWGAGKVASYWLEHIPETMPEVAPKFIVDSKATKMNNSDIPVVSPDSIEDWKKYFVVIAVMHREEIEKYLEARGMKRGTDFCSYEIYFGTEVLNSDKTLVTIETQLYRGEIKKGKHLIVAPMWGERGSKEIFAFFKKYIKGNNPENFIILSGSYYIDKRHIKEQLGCELVSYCIPKKAELETQKWLDMLDELSQDELDWLAEMENRKFTDNVPELIQMRYLYYKKIFEMLEPKSMIWWGGWARDSYIVGYLAKKYNTKFCYAEYGWLPGTLQFDCGGIAGQSILCRPEGKIHLPDISEKEAIKIMAPIRDYVSNMELKCVDEEEILREQEKIEKLDAGKRTYFLVGMGDAGMDMNPATPYWKEHISEVVEGSQDAFEKVVEICKKNNWNLIYKPHPAEFPDQKRVEVIEAENVVLIHDMPVEMLIEKADVVVSITSAVDFKALLLGKPLVQLGKNSLNMAGCTYLVKSSDEIEEQMLRAGEHRLTEVQRVNYDIHMSQLLRTVLWDDMSTREVRYGKTPEQNIFEENSIEELIKAPIPVVFTPDENFMVQTCVAILSMLRSKREETVYHFYILVSSEINQDCLKYLEQLKKIEKDFWYEVTYFDSRNIDNQKINTAHVTSSTFYRLFLANIYDFDRCMYHDGDIIVNEDLTDMYQVDMGDSYVAGVMTIVQHQGFVRDKQLIDIWHFKSMDQYIFAGDLTMNLKKIREDDMTNIFRWEMQKGYPQQDQDVINFCCYDHITFLPLKYCMLNRWLYNDSLHDYENQIYTEAEMNEAKTRPAIVHFAGDVVKPWVNLRTAYAKEWWQYARELLDDDEFAVWYGRTEKITKERDWAGYIEQLCKPDGEVFIFGFTNRAKELYYDLRNNGVKVRGFVDNAIEKQGQIVDDIRVYSLEEVLQLKNQIFTIASQRAKQEIKEQLLQNGILEEQIVDFKNKSELYYLSLHPDYFEVEYQDLMLPKLGSSVYEKSIEELKEMDKEMLWKRIWK